VRNVLQASIRREMEENRDVGVPNIGLHEFRKYAVTKIRRLKIL
jgi:hypothetical protein